MLYLLYKIGLFVLRFATTEAAYSIVSFFAKLKYIFSKRDKELVKTNLRNVIPDASDKEISSLAENVFENFGRYLVDFFSLIKNQSDYLKKTVQIIGTENIDEALRLGKGCILMGGHLGNWELGGCAVANRGYKINTIALAHLDSRINNLFIGQRKKSGMNVMHIGAAKTACQKALSRGESIAMLGDRPFGDRGVEIEFFGKKAIFPRGAALFSLRNGSPIVMTFIYKENVRKNQYKLIFEKPLLIRGGDDFNNQLKEITQRFADRFEHYIRKYPSQWYMFNKVWS